MVAAILLLVGSCSDSIDDVPDPEPLRERYELSSADSFPEGVAFDPFERVFYATSLQGGSITRIAPDGEETVFREADGRASLAGAKVNAAERQLWVCARNVDGLDDRVWVFDLETAELVMEYVLDDLVSGGTCNDLALDAAGVAYVTDTENPFLYRLDPQNGEGSILATDPMFEDNLGQGTGLNGIVVTPDETALIVSKFFPSQLFRVSLPDGDNVTPITLTGDAITTIVSSPLGDVPLGGDGLALLAGDLFAVSPGAVSRVRLAEDYSAGVVVAVPQTDGNGLTTATEAEGELYVIKSEVAALILEQPPQLPFEIFRVDLAAFGP